MLFGYGLFSPARKPRQFPSQYRPYFVPAWPQVRIWGDADMDLQAKPAGSVETTPKQTWSVGNYLGPLLASFFLISGVSYKTTFNRELRIASSLSHNNIAQ